MVEAFQIDALPLCRFLLPCDHEEVLIANAMRDDDAMQKKKRQKRVSKKPEIDTTGDIDDISKVEKFKVEHLNAYMEAGVAWPPVYDDDFLEISGCLVPRAQQILWLDHKYHGPTTELKHWVAKDLNMTLEWGRCLENVFPCIVSSATMWLRGPIVQLDGEIIHVDRMLCGAELLSLQGVSLHLQSLSSSDQLSHNEKSDLAGNAFSGNVVLAIFLSLITCSPLEVAFELFTGVATKDVQVASAVEVDDDDDACSGQEEDGESESSIEKSDVVAGMDGDDVGDLSM